MKRYILATLLAGFLAAPISAKEKPFYDSKSNIVCITAIIICWHMAINTAR